MWGFLSPSSSSAAAWTWQAPQSSKNLRCAAYSSWRHQGTWNQVSQFDLNRTYSNDESFSEDVFFFGPNITKNEEISKRGIFKTKKIGLNLTRGAIAFLIDRSVTRVAKSHQSSVQCIHRPTVQQAVCTNPTVQAVYHPTVQQATLRANYSSVCSVKICTEQVSPQCNFSSVQCNECCTCSVH